MREADAPWSIPARFRGGRSSSSKLHHRLAGTDGLAPGPLLERLQGVWRDVGRENEDGVHLLLNAGLLKEAEWADLEAHARRDPAGNPIAATVPVTAFLPLLGLPHAALVAIPYAPVAQFLRYAYT